MNISSFRELPDVIKNILIINCLLYLATITLESQGINLTKILGLHQFQSPIPRALGRCISLLR